MNGELKNILKGSGRGLIEVLTRHFLRATEGRKP
jgi:hypothetical protein